MIIEKSQNRAWELLLKAIDCSNKYHQENCVIVATDWPLHRGQSRLSTAPEQSCLLPVRLFWVLLQWLCYLENKIRI